MQGNSPQTMIRVIDASYNAPAVDVNIATTPIAVNIAAQTITNYAFLPPENATAYIYPTGTKKATASASGNFLASEEHSILLTDSGTGYAATVLTDQTTAPPLGDVAIRFVQEAQAVGLVDLYLVPSSSTLAGAKPVLAKVAAGTVTDYVDIPAGTYTVVVTPTGDITKAYSSASLVLSGGAARTAVVMDSQLTANPPVTVVIGNDRD